MQTYCCHAFLKQNAVPQGHSSKHEQRAELLGFGPGNPSIALCMIHGIHYALLADEGDLEGFGAEEDEDEHEGEAVQHAQAGAAAAKTGGTLRQVRKSLSSLRVCVAAAALLQCCSSCITTMYVLRCSLSCTSHDSHQLATPLLHSQCLMLQKAYALFCVILQIALMLSQKLAILTAAVSIACVEVLTSLLLSNDRLDSKLAEQMGAPGAVQTEPVHTGSSLPPWIRTPYCRHLPLAKPRPSCGQPRGYPHPYLCPRNPDLYTSQQTRMGSTAQ